MPQLRFASGFLDDVRDRARAAGSKAVGAFEKSAQIRLPADYATFLTTINGGRIDGSWAFRRGGSSLANLYGLRRDRLSLARQRALHCPPATRSRRGALFNLPGDAIPIGEDLEQNLICLAIGKSAFGSVWYWPHDTDCEGYSPESSVTNAAHMVKVATSFASFAKSLKRQGPTPNATIERLLKADDGERMTALLPSMSKAQLAKRQPPGYSTLLERACALGARRVAGVLIAAGAPGDRALGDAVSENQAAIVELLLSRGWKIEPELYEIAVRGDSAESLAALLKHGPKPSKSALQRAAKAARHSKEPKAGKIRSVLERYAKRSGLHGVLA